jgi:N-acylglucosamine-6-phosphate 2-epimerase
MRSLEARKLIVSCQARDDNPLTGAVFMRAMALAAMQGGAGAIRANGSKDIRAIREVTDLPIIGLLKKDIAGFEAYITPDVESVLEVARAGADIVAVDATSQTRAVPLEVLLAAIRAEEKLAFADCATPEDAARASGMGFDFVSSTMAGYTAETAHRKSDEPDFEALEGMIRSSSVSVIAEGRFWTPAHCARALELGAFAVVVGTAITNPRDTTKYFMKYGGFA